jgi:hypothetical protein
MDKMKKTNETVKKSRAVRDRFEAPEFPRPDRDQLCLGLEMRDRITGATGIATAVTVWLTGCTRYAVQGPAGDDSKVPEANWSDRDALEIIGPGVKMDVQVPGGPSAPPRRDKDPI